MSRGKKGVKKVHKTKQVKEKVKKSKIHYSSDEGSIISEKSDIEEVDSFADENEESEFEEDTEDELNISDNDDEIKDEEGCLYNSVKKSKKTPFFSFQDDDEDLDDGNVFIEDDINEQKNIYVASDERQTKPILFPFERVKLLQIRATQITNGAKPMLNVNKFLVSPKEIANREINEGVIPLIVIRKLPNGKIEKWKVNELTNYNIS